MSMGQFGVDIQQLTGCEDVSPHRVCQVLRQTFQLSTHAGGQQGLVKILRCGWLVLRWGRPRFWYAAFLILASAPAARFVAIRLSIPGAAKNSCLAFSVLSAPLEAPSFPSASRIDLSLPLLTTESTVATVTALVPRCSILASLSFAIVPPSASPGLPGAAPELGGALLITRTATSTAILSPGTAPWGFSFKSHDPILPKRSGEPNFHHALEGSDDGSSSHKDDCRRSRASVCFCVGVVVPPDTFGVCGGMLWLCVRRRLTLPHTCVCSTISAGRLNFRVRDGSGCFPLAMATGTGL